VLGPIADQVAREMKSSLTGLSQAVPPAIAAPALAAAGPRVDASAILAALGGQANVREIATASSRLRIAVSDVLRVDEAALRQLGARGVVKPTAETIQVIIGPTAEVLAEDLKGLLPA